MDIILRGEHDVNSMNDHLMDVLHVLKDKYHIGQFREIHLSLTLVDEEGYDVELVDTQSEKVYRFFEIVPQGSELSTSNKARTYPQLRLVIDNTK